MEATTHDSFGESDNIESRLWDYIDGTTIGTARSTIEELIRTNTLWKTKYSELMDVHSLMQSSELENPSMRFTKNVMEEIGRLHISPATKTYINKRVVWGIGFFFLTLLIGFLIYGFVQVQWGSTGDPDNPVTRNVTRLDKLDLSKFFSNTWVNAFMIINVVLGLFLLDNYLSNKKKNFKKV